MGVRELLLVRHGESEGNVAAAEAARAGAETIDLPARDADVRLSGLGRQQAAAVGDALAAMSAAEAPEALACSPYVRARETARIACERADVELTTRVDERLRDRELGVLDGLTTLGVRARHPDEAARRAWLGKFYHRPAGGESWADVALRLRSWLADLDGALDGRRVLVVSHDAVIALVRYVCEGLDEQQVLDIASRQPMRNAALTRIVRGDDQSWTTRTYDDVRHLEAAGLSVTRHRGERHVGP